jgi:hypothetical protein
MEAVPERSARTRPWSSRRARWRRRSCARSGSR